MLFPKEDPFPELNLAALTPDNSNEIETVEEEAPGTTASRRSSAGRRESAMIAASSLKSFGRPTLDKRTSAFNTSEASLNGSSNWSKSRKNVVH